MLVTPSWNAFLLRCHVISLLPFSLPAWLTVSVAASVPLLSHPAISYSHLSSHFLLLVTELLMFVMSLVLLILYTEMSLPWELCSIIQKKLCRFNAHVQAYVKWSLSWTGSLERTRYTTSTQAPVILRRHLVSPQKKHASEIVAWWLEHLAVLLGEQGSTWFLYLLHEDYLARQQQIKSCS